MISDLITLADDATDAVAEIERTGTPGDVIREMNDELADLRARMVERDALLRKVCRVGLIGYLKDEIEAALSASAEPSAPKCEHNHKVYNIGDGAGHCKDCGVVTGHPVNRKSSVSSLDELSRGVWVSEKVLNRIEELRLTCPEKEMVAIVESALRRSFKLGQLYWQQADSDSTCQQNKSDQTMEVQAQHILNVVKSIKGLTQ